MAGLIDKILRRDNQKLTYDKAKELAAHEDEAVRAELAQRTDVLPEILYFLAEDPSPLVRRLIAENKATPHHADLILARDDDLDVRGGLAGKISRLAPELHPDDQDKVKRMAYEALEVLTRDQVTRVRQILAEALKDVADAPPEVIRRLAFDIEIVVAGPVLENSPVLTDADLLEIIEKGTANGRLGFISRRQGVSGDVSQAIAGAGDDDAVALLLANPSAQIREETLDAIIDRAETIESWHAPLVARPKLSSLATLRLARFVAANLIEVLAARRDLAPDVLEEVRRVVDERIGAGEGGLPPLGGEGGLPPPGGEGEDSATPLEQAFAEAERLHQGGELTLGYLGGVIRAGKPEPVMAALAVLAGIPIMAVQKAALSKNQKGLVAVAWKAGLTADLAERVQGCLLGVDAADVMKATDGGDYPMSEGDMEWQFEFVCDLA